MTALGAKDEKTREFANIIDVLAITDVRLATAAARAAGEPQGRNSPQQLPRIGAALAALRGITPEAMAQASTANAVAALPRLGPLLAG